MIQIDDKTKCCGCTACESICPKKCIQMKTDEEGFKYPSIDLSKCIGCNMCKKVCPIINHKEISGELEAVAVQHKDSDTLYHSAAGGAFSAIGAITIQHGGIVFGAAYDDNMVVRHSSAETIEELVKFRSSKYVQSDIGDTFSKVENELKSGREVCFSGTPCQVAGLKGFLRKEYENLITVDLVCKGVASPLVLEKYVEDKTQEYGSRIVGMNFKRKTYGYHSSTMSIDFQNGQSYSCGGITDPMMRCFRANICLRPSCAECSFKGDHRVSDLTIFDCWHYEKLANKKDNDKGHTAVLIHSLKGNIRIYKCGDLLDIDKIDSQEAIAHDGIMVKDRAKNHDKRREFFEILNQRGLDFAIGQTIPISFFDICKDKSKKILYRLKILNLIKCIGAK